MVGEVFAGLGAFKTILDGAKALAQMNNESVRLQASIDLQRQIFSAQQDYATLLEQVRALETKVTEFEKWEAERERYELKDLGWGVMAYMLKPKERGSTPPHWVCPKCVEDKKIRIIHQWFKAGRGTILSCPTCRLELRPESGSPEWKNEEPNVSQDGN